MEAGVGLEPLGPDDRCRRSVAQHFLLGPERGKRSPVDPETGLFYRRTFYDDTKGVAFINGLTIVEAFGKTPPVPRTSFGQTVCGEPQKCFPDRPTAGPELAGKLSLGCLVGDCTIGARHHDFFQQLLVGRAWKLTPERVKPDGVDIVEVKALLMAAFEKAMLFEKLQHIANRRARGSQLLGQLEIGDMGARFPPSGRNSIKDHFCNVDLQAA